MPTTTNAKVSIKSGDTVLRNIRVEPELWNPAGEAAARAGTDRSKVARDAYAELIARERDPLWQELLRLAEARGTTVDALQRAALEQYVKRTTRKRKT